MNGISEIILRAPDGRERRTLVWFPNEQVRQDYYAKAHKRGLEIIEKVIPGSDDVTGKGN